MRAGSGRSRSSRRHPRRLPRLALVLLLLGAAAAAASAQGDPPEAPPSSDEVRARQAELGAEHDAALAGGAAAPAIELLERLDLLLEQQIAALAEHSQRQTALEAAESAVRDLRRDGLPEPPPYRLRQLDEALEEQRSFALRVDRASAGVEAASEALDEARENLALRERSRREAKDAARPGTGESEAELRVRQLRSRVAAEQVALRSIELENARLVRRIHEIGAERLAVRVQQLAAGARFSEAELGEQLARIDDEETALRGELAAAKKGVASAERRWITAQRGTDPGSRDEVAARRLALETQQLAVTTLAQAIQRLAEARELWQRRLAIASGGEERRHLAAWADELRRARDELVRQQRLQQSQIAELNAERRKQESRPAEEAPGDPRLLRAQAEETTAQLHLHERALAHLDEVQRLQQRTLAELDAALRTVSITERLGDAWSAIGAAWRYELFAVDDRPITVGRVAIGALLLVVGLLFSGFLSRLFGRRVLPRLGLEAGAAAAVESLLYYAFVVGLALLALRTVNVPLTAFTLLGGAAAIGLGFGSQNVINNFISGLILFAERPIRVGDMIEIDGTYGSVESIGARSTRVRSFTGIHIIVPNSAFLEKNVVNWTLSDDRVRTHVAVGVAYGSPVDDVLRLIRKAVDDQPGVLRAPEPVVLFSDFGNDALLFEVHFWIRMRTLMDRRRMESDVRRTLSQLFSGAQIVIAFPQRDVHLDASAPLPVRMVRDPE